MRCLSVFILTLELVFSCAIACTVNDQGVTKDIEMILKKHNELRMRVATGGVENMPEASNMLEMEWDKDVAANAQQWANKCQYKEDTKEERNTTRGYIGQNIAYRSNNNRSANWEEVIESFYDEISKFNASDIDEFHFQEEFGHFTQVIWANTSKIGCGYIMIQTGNNTYYHLYGCYYLPGGNIEGEPIYLEVCESDESCSEGDESCCEGDEPCSECGGCGSINGLCNPPS